jgi:hypothetical protein
LQNAALKPLVVLRGHKPLTNRKKLAIGFPFGCAKYLILPFWFIDNAILSKVKECRELFLFEKQRKGINASSRTMPAGKGTGIEVGKTRIDDWGKGMEKGESRCALVSQNKIKQWPCGEERAFRC